MKLYVLKTAQQVPITLDEAWDFFSNPANLNRLMPPDMPFNIIEGGGEPTFAGQIIRYRIAPIANIPMNWVTEITQCVPKSYFVDEQRFGPYAFWHHIHRFKENEQGVLIEDVLHYGLPMGWLGRLFAGKFVQNQIKNIFDYRQKKLEEMYPMTKTVNS